MIAEHVMGWTWINAEFRDDGSHWFVPSGINPTTQRREQIPDYSTSIAAAWHVVEKMRDLGWGFELQCIHLNDAVFSRRSGDRERVHADDCATVPLSICLAALQAVSSREAPADGR